MIGKKRLLREIEERFNMDYVNWTNDKETICDFIADLYKHDAKRGADE